MCGIPLSNDQILSYLKEDLGSSDTENILEGDVTTNSIESLKSNNFTFQLISKNEKEFVLCGVEVLELTLKSFAKNPFKIELHFKDGSVVKKGEKILEGTANSRDFLIAERVALNLMQQLSAVSTKTAEFVRLLEGTKIKILDTRKTLPNMRQLQKYAVRCGGGHNHRFGLYDMIMIKDNHIAASGGISKAIESVLNNPKAQNLKIEVECESLSDVEECLRYPIHRIMLDNMSPEKIVPASKLIRSTNSQVEIEASGGINLSNIETYKDLDIDFISIGALTHSINSVDISARINS